MSTSAENLNAAYDAVVQSILEYGLTVPEVVRMIESKGIAVEGEYALPVREGDESVLLWDGLSEEAAELVARLTRDSRVQRVPSDALSYLDSGIVSPLPFASPGSLARGYSYKTPHLLVTEFRKRESE